MAFAGFVHLILTYRYWILFPIACFEGPVTGFVLGTLVALGYFNPVGAYVLLVLGDVVPDWFYYLLGRYGKNTKFVTKYFGKEGKMEDQFNAVHKLWHEQTGKTMFFSKLAYGFSTALLISSGLAGLSPGMFLLYALPVTLVQYFILMGLGYYFGSSYYSIIPSSVTGVGIFIAVVIAVAIIYYVLAHYMSRKFLKSSK